MLNDLKNLALIPARGGSKRLPGKNIKLLGGKPLVSYTIECALKSGCFDKIVLSTDSQEILEVGKGYKGVVFDKRPVELASDTATIRPVALELMERYANANEIYDVITLMVPTCVFRKPHDIINGFKLLTVNIDAVISVSPYEFPPPKGLILDSNGLAQPAWPDSPLLAGITRTQDQIPVYHENGVFFICRWSSLIKNRSYYVGKVKPYFMKQILVDIDSELDFQYAQFLIDTGRISFD